MSNFIREFNFWPKCKNLNEWYSAADWQSMNDVTYWHEEGLGKGLRPEIPANYMAGILVPFDGTVADLNAWIVPDQNRNAVTEIVLYKYRLLEAGPAQQVSAVLLVSGSDTPNHNWYTSILQPEVKKGDCLLLCARESSVRSSNPHVFGNIVITPTAVD